MTVSNSGSGEPSGSSSAQLQPAGPPTPASPAPNPAVKKKRNLPGTPDPDAEVIALSPRALLATNRFVCEICNKGFQRDQNLQLHRRGHNLPWKLRQRTGKEARKRVYVCPEPSCVHHDPARALGDLTGIKKHFCRKHGEKKWKCDKCSKKYAVQSDWKAHSKVCGTREYRCDCGTLFSRRDSFITHRAFCDALAEENAKAGPAAPTPNPNLKHVVDDERKSAQEETTPLPLSPVVEVAGTDAKVVVEAPLPPLQVAPLDRREPENSTGLLQYVPPPTNTSPAAATATTTSNSSSSSNNNNSTFASLFASVSTTAAAHSGATFSDLMSAMGHADRSLLEPPSLCLASNGGPSSLFSPQAQSQSHDRRPFAAPPPSPHMSATALLQKAAQMGAAATGSSFLKGFGLDAPSAHQEPIRDHSLRWGHQQHLEPEPASMLCAGLELGLPYQPDLMMGPSALFGPKPATLDFLGLGMGPVGGTPSGGLSTLITSIGGSGIDMGSGTATVRWEAAERKTN